VQRLSQLLELKCVRKVSAHHQGFTGLDRQLERQAMHGRPGQLQAQCRAIANREFLLGFAFPELLLVALHLHR